MINLKKNKLILILIIISSHCLISEEDILHIKTQCFQEFLTSHKDLEKSKNVPQSCKYWYAIGNFENKRGANSTDQWEYYIIVYFLSL